MESEKFVIIFKNIYPDLNKNLINDLKLLENKFNIKLDFLLDDGIKVKYPGDLYEPSDKFGDFALIDSKDKSPIIKITENFNFIEIYNYITSLTLIIPILENYDL